MVLEGATESWLGWRPGDADALTDERGARRERFVARDLDAEMRVRRPEWPPLESFPRDVVRDWALLRVVNRCRLAE